VSGLGDPVLRGGEAGSNESWGKNFMGKKPTLSGCVVHSLLLQGRKFKADVSRRGR